MKRIAFSICLIVVCVTSSAWAGNYGLDGYRERLVTDHGPLVSIPTYLGATVGAVAMVPVSVVYGAASLIPFTPLRENPTRIVKSLLMAPEKGWYWGGIILGTPFRIVKGVVWDVPTGIVGLFFGDGEKDAEKPEAEKPVFPQTGGRRHESKGIV
jgi:hypothetical protein